MRTPRQDPGLINTAPTRRIRTHIYNAKLSPLAAPPDVAQMFSRILAADKAKKRKR
jgi:hypothetical protein